MTIAYPSPPGLARRLTRTVFQAGHGGYELYRIPVLAATARGTLLAACQARRSSQGDWHETHLLLRRSEDGGATWDAARPLHGDHAGEPHNPLRSRGGHPGGDGLVHGNAVFVATPSGVHVVYCLEYHRVFHRLSADDGRTWSPAREITAALDPLRARYPFRVCATGPGHGIRLRDGTLAIPVWLSLAGSPDGHRPSVVAVLLGGQDGTDWRIGELAAVDGGHAADGRTIVNPSEGALVELDDGSVLLGMRSESQPNRRLHAVSSDGGRSFAQPYFADGLFDAVCEASYLRCGGRILFAAPDPSDQPAVGGRSQPRRRLVLAAAAGDGTGWRQLGVVEDGIAGYSHLAAHGDRVWCLYECGSTDGNHYRSGSLQLVELEPA